VTFESELRAELRRVGVDARRARRIELELADHRRCDPAAELGTPHEIAERFAAELQLPLTLRAGKIGFAALASTATMLCASVLAFAAADAWAQADLFEARGAVVAVAGSVALIAAQLSFVAGVLALVPLLRRQGLRLAQRRLSVALWAALAVTMAELVQAVALASYVPRWLTVLMLAAAVVPALLLAASVRSVHRAARLTADAVFRPAIPPGVLGAVAVLAVALMTVGGAVAERSWQEGLTRGVLEAAGIGICFAAFARRLALRT
jgi:hypothetical protein